MEILLDTSTLLYALFSPKELPENIRNLINSKKNRVFVSCASLWEIEIKHNKNPKLMPCSYKDVYNLLTTKAEYDIFSLHYSELECYNEIAEQNIHKDPFDIMLLSLAKHEEFTFITNDSILAKYKGVDVVTF